MKFPFNKRAPIPSILSNTWMTIHQNFRCSNQLLETSNRFSTIQVNTFHSVNWPHYTVTIQWTAELCNTLCFSFHTWVHTSNEQRVCLYIGRKGVRVRMCVLAPTDPVWLLCSLLVVFSPQHGVRKWPLWPKTEHITPIQSSWAGKRSPRASDSRDIQHNQSSLTLKQIIPMSRFF